MLAIIKEYLQKLNKTESGIFLVGLSFGLGLGYWQFAPPQQKLANQTAHLLQSQQQVQNCQIEKELNLQKQYDDLQQAKRTLLERETQMLALELKHNATQASLSQTREKIRDISESADPSDCIHQPLPSGLRYDTF